MRILVTGHLGYIGTVLTPMLLRSGHDVVGLDTDLYGRCTYGDPVSIPYVPTMHADIRDIDLDDLRGFDAVAHLAALSNDPLGDFRPPLTDIINHRAAVELARCAKAAGVRRFVFSSTCSNYGAGGEGWLDEDAPFNPVTPYGRAKVQAEQSIRALADDSFTPVILRSATAFGFSPRIRFDLVVNNLVAWAYSTGHVRLKSDGRSWRPVVHVEDIARAFKAVLEAPREQVHDEAFNVGRTDQNFRVRDIAEMIAQVVPDCDVTFAESARSDPRCYRVCCDKLPQRVPAFEAQWDVVAGARQLYEIFRAYGITPESFEGCAYQRLAHLKQRLDDGEIDEAFRLVERFPRVGAMA
ncbi:MAG: NAD-dependent epimerase/dehydratase family protein [Phycisphaeraceae bacterium]